MTTAFSDEKEPSAVLCETCKKRLFSYGQLALFIVQAACDQAILSVPILIDEEDATTWNSLAPVIKYLEGKGYIVTIEIDDCRLSVKPTNYDVSEVFCWCKYMVENK